MEPSAKAGGQAAFQRQWDCDSYWREQASVTVPPSSAPKMLHVMYSSAISNPSPRKQDYKPRTTPAAPRSHYRAAPQPLASSLWPGGHFCEGVNKGKEEGKPSQPGDETCRQGKEKEKAPVGGDN